jgi:hypothetical protein
MTGVINCSSCGAANQLPEGKTSMFCAFCGGKVEMQIVNQNFEKSSKPKLKKSKIKGELAYRDRGINSLQEIIELYSDSELEEINNLILPNNKIKSLKGLSRFKEATKIDLSFNEIEYINELPCYSNYFKALYFIKLDFSVNENLLDITDEAIQNLNNAIKVATLDINLKGALKFNLDSLAKINFNKILKEQGICVSIIPPSPNISIPLSLKNIGFNVSQHKNIEDRKWIKSKEDNKVITNNNSNKKEGCFVATAAMGSYNHPEVIELRIFRDNWILEKKWGKGFVTWYYHYGSIAAKFIEKSLVLKKICYLLIVKPLVYLTRIVKFK